MENKLKIFLDKAFAIHKNEYDYSKSNYINSHTKLCIICKKHGEFFQTPMGHINQKQKCPKCAIENKKYNNITTTEFIKRAKQKWGDTYDYEITNYINKNTKIQFICPKHGLQEQKPNLHIKNGCQFCNGRGISKYDTATFIKKAKEIHNNFYSYDKTILSSINNKIIITCPIHGDFNQKAANHIHLKNGCPKWNGGVSINNSDFIEKSINKHGNKFDYSNTNYIDSHKTVEIKCQKHGIFKQKAYLHLQTIHCCPFCVSELTSSCQEKELLEFVKNNYSQNILSNDRTALLNKEIDIYLPDINLGIEFNGNYWHTENIVGKNYHLNKTNLAIKNNIKLLQIFESEWNEKQEIVKSRILSNIGINQKIYARKTKIINISLEEKNNFLEKTHIQGKDNSTIYFGLSFNDELIACMTFGKPRFNNKYKYELIRYSSKLNTNVIGGASKLLNHFICNFTGSIISYADRRWSNGSLYEKLGFYKSHITKPNYFYYNISNKKCYNRMKFQKHKLKNMPFFDEKLTEYEIMKLNGYDRIWDCGNICYIKY